MSLCISDTCRFLMQEYEQMYRCYYRDYTYLMSVYLYYLIQWIFFVMRLQKCGHYTVGVWELLLHKDKSLVIHLFVGDMTSTTAVS